VGLDLFPDDPQSRMTDDQAFRFVERAASSGSNEGLIELGLCYFGGRWVSPDRARAIDCWRRASSAGSMEGSIRVAMITVRTEGDPAKLDEALATLQRGSAIGSILAEVGLAYCYETGTRTKHSKGTAAGIYRRAAYRGSRDAYNSLLRLHDEIRPAEKEFEIPED
jgi:TPR repeat protein